MWSASAPSVCQTAHHVLLAVNQYQNEIINNRVLNICIICRSNFKSNCRIDANYVFSSVSQTNDLFFFGDMWIKTGWQNVHGSFSFVIFFFLDRVHSVCTNERVKRLWHSTTFFTAISQYLWLSPSKPSADLPTAPSCHCIFSVLFLLWLQDCRLPPCS